MSVCGLCDYVLDAYKTDLFLALLLLYQGISRAISIVATHTHTHTPLISVVICDASNMAVICVTL